jgi:FMN-dependent NADH-azoreductase
VKILYIKCNPKPDNESFTHRISKEFIKEYAKKNPDHSISEINLYEYGIEHLSYESMCQVFENNGRMFETAKDFSSYDKYIIAAPMWNLSIPSILKAYIDHIVVKGITFRYNKFGLPIGLMKNKKAIYLGTRGGSYPFPLSLFAFDVRYVRYVLRFIGIKNFKSFILENIDKNRIKAENKLESNLKKVRVLAKNF